MRTCVLLLASSRTALCSSGGVIFINNLLYYNIRI